MSTVLSTTTGNITLRNQSGQVRVFHCPHAGGKGNKEVFLDKAATVGPAVSVVQKIGTPRFAASVAGLRQDIVGTYVEQAFSIAEGEIVKVFVDTRNTLGKRFKRGSIYLRMRAAAAHRVLEIQVTDHASASFTKGVIEGTFDILTLDELDAAGVSIRPEYRKFCERAVTRKLITKNVVLREEIAAAPKVVKKVVSSSPSGEETKEVFEVARPRRKLGR